jgi:CHAD domain-containing protein
MSAIPAVASTKSAAKKSGLAFWMERVLEECERTGVALEADPVHDLRVALRRCRSMADGFRVMDPDPSWKQMKKAGKQLFAELGELRDMQIMDEWVHRLGDPDDPITHTLFRFLASQEARLKQEAAVALQDFDRKQWKKWITSLPRRAGRVRPGSLLFKHLALERWTEAHELHRRALRNRSQLGFHQLRIGLKRFRYIVENFLPEQNTAWSDNLKELQDLLGEVHDLDVLWATALRIKALPDSDARSRWRKLILEERTRRIDKYRSKTVGKASLWQVWRADLPMGKQIELAALNRLKLWASFLDPEFKHAQHVTRLALQLYDGLPAGRKLAESAPDGERAILQVASLLHDVGRFKNEKGHHKDTFNLIRRASPPLGWSSERLRMAGAVARYHRGALPRAGQKPLVGLNSSQRQTVVRLAGVLRLANAFDSERDAQVHHLDVHEKNGILEVAAQGYSARDRIAENVAAARHLLELVYRRPVMVKPLRSPVPKTARS